jgi:hypothetical protein
MVSMEIPEFFSVLLIIKKKIEVVAKYSLGTWTKCLSRLSLIHI